MAETILVPGRAVNSQLREWMQSQGIDPDLYTLRRKDEMTDEELEELLAQKVRSEVVAEGPYTN